jgi:hypothetical protein
MAYVYQHIRNDTNEIFYIGMGSDTNGTYRRANTKKGRNEHWHNVVNKAGYKVEILTDCITKELASDEEKRLIKLYGRKNNNTGILVNMTDGGEGTTGRFYGPAWNKGKTNIYSEEIREKIRQANRDRIYTPETRRKLSEAKKGVAFKMRTDWLDTTTTSPYKKFKNLKPITELTPTDYLLATLIADKVKEGADVEYWNSILSKCKWVGKYTQLKRLRDKIKYLIQISQNQIHKSSDTLDK